MDLNKIKKYKGKMISLTYGNGSNNIIAGRITAATSKHILFRINSDENLEIPINHTKIVNIEQLKTFSHSIRKAKRLISENRKKEASELLEYCDKMFNLDEQIKEINLLKLKL